MKNATKVTQLHKYNTTKQKTNPISNSYPTAAVYIDVVELVSKTVGFHDVGNWTVEHANPTNIRVICSTGTACVVVELCGNNATASSSVVVDWVLFSWISECQFFNRVF